MCEQCLSLSSSFHRSSLTLRLIPPPATLHRIDTYLAERTAQGVFRGSVLIGIDGHIAFEKGYGLANEEWSNANTTTTKFRIASLTKQFTGTCILLLQERNLLSVHDPVSKYVSDLPPAWQSITLHQLLTHTSGISQFHRRAEGGRALVASASRRGRHWALSRQSRWTSCPERSCTTRTPATSCWAW